MLYIIIKTNFVECFQKQIPSTPALRSNYNPNNGGRICHPNSLLSLLHPAGQHTLVPLCRRVSSCFVSLFSQQQVVQFDDNVGKVCEVHKVRGDDVDPVHPRPLGLDPGHDGWQVSGAKREESLY